MEFSCSVAPSSAVLTVERYSDEFPDPEVSSAALRRIPRP